MTPRPASDAEWLRLSGLLTGLLGFIALGLMFVLPVGALPDPIFSLASWIGWTFMVSAATVFIYTLKLLRMGEERPLKRLAENWQLDRRRYAMIAAGMALAGADMYFFMILKPELNLLFPFWADPRLASIDAHLAGRDAWRFFAAWNLNVVAWVYSPLWFFGILLTFYWLLLKPASTTKATAIVSYFATWSIFGPIGQALFSSGGPIFYGRLGFGDRFDAMPTPALTRMLSNYLWNSYNHRSLAPGAGISAMPSLHIATMAWMVMVFLSFRSRWLFPAVLMSLYIYAGSVALGWHYMTDGLVGAAGAALCFYVSRRYFYRGASLSSQWRPASRQPRLR